MRRALAWAHSHRGWKLKDFARAIDQPEHNLSNFIRRRSKRPGNLFLGCLHKFFESHAELLPDDMPRRSTSTGAPVETKATGGRARYGLVSNDVAISADDLRRVFKRYASYYFCFSVLEGFDDALMCALLHIRPIRQGENFGDSDLPLPRFTLMIEVPDLASPGRSKRNVVAGYVISRNGKIFLTGHYDGELQYLILQEPREKRFRYIHGRLLMTLLGPDAPSATSLVCRRLGSTYDRSTWAPMVRTYGIAAFRNAFEDSDTIVKALRIRAPRDAALG